MSQQPGDWEHHPRWYRRRVSTYWWLGRVAYFLFILRELSSAFIAWFVVYTLLLIRAVSQHPNAYQALPEWSRWPGIIVLNVISLFFIVFHAITWLNLAPKAMVVRLRGRRVPGAGIVLSNYAIWGLVSVLIIWIVYGV